MERLSYGGGMFSPLRCDTSLNDDAFKGQRESDIFSSWKDICVGDSLVKNSEEFSKAIGNTTEDDSEFAVKPKARLSSNKYEKSLHTSSDSSKGKLSYITTRKKSSTQIKQTSPENFPKPATSESKTKKKKDSLPKHVSVRSDISKGNEFRSSKTRQSNNSYATPSLPSLTEEHFGIKSLSPENASEKKVRNVTSAQFDVMKLSNETCIKEKKLNSLASLKELTTNQSEIRTCKPTTDCEVQTDLLMSELNFSSGKTLGDSVSFNYQSTSASSLPIFSKPQQIQASSVEKLVKDTVSFEFGNIRQMLYHQQLSLFKYMDKNLNRTDIIEKLVKDAVGFEFDEMRQMLYLQQLSLFKYMDRNFETERQSLTKCIAALMEENKRLREDVSAHQTF